MSVGPAVLGVLAGWFEGTGYDATERNGRPIDWTRDALTEREAKLRVSLLKRVDGRSRGCEETTGLMLLTAFAELQTLGVPIETWGRDAAEHLAADVRSFWTTLAHDADALRLAAQERTRQQRFVEAIAEIDGPADPSYPMDRS